MDSSNEYLLRPVLESQELMSLAEKIKDDVPYCCNVYNNLLLSARGHNSEYNYRFYVPEKYLESHIVIWIQKTNVVSLSFHCKEEEVPLLIKIIQGSDILPTCKGSHIVGFHLADHILDQVCEVLGREFHKTCGKLPSITFTYVTPQNYPLRCPPGMRVQRLGKEGIRHLLKMSKYSKEESLDLTCNFAAKIPHLGVYLDPVVTEETTVNLENLEFADAEKIPISWVSVTSFGDIGSLMTDTEYRGRGLAKLLMEATGRLQRADGYIPHAHVEPGNDASHGMFKKLIGWEETHNDCWIY